MDQIQDTKDNGQDLLAELTSAPFVDESGQVPPEILERIFAERAARLAQAPEEEETGEQITLLLVRLGRELYGLDARYVDRIEPVEHLTPVPRVPKWVAGVTNLRGRVLSVIDLARLFGLSFAPGQENGGNGAEGPVEPYLVVVEAADMALALIVDNVLAVERIPMSRVQAATDTVRGLRSEYVLGIAERRDNPLTQGNDSNPMMVVLDLPNLLADERLIVHEEIV